MDSQGCEVLGVLSSEKLRGNLLQGYYTKDYFIEF